MCAATQRNQPFRIAIKLNQSTVATMYGSPNDYQQVSQTAVIQLDNGDFVYPFVSHSPSPTEEGKMANLGLKYFFWIQIESSWFVIPVFVFIFNSFPGYINAFVGVIQLDNLFSFVQITNTKLQWD